MKTTDSEFWGFIRDENTTLPDTKDRIFGTSVSVHWLYNNAKADYQAAYEAVSRMPFWSVSRPITVWQCSNTMNEIGQLALNRVPDISEISLVMPNEHRIPFNLQRSIWKDKNEIFVTTDEPYGLISATLKRS